MGQIIEFPDDKKARERIEALKQTLEELIFEKNHLQFITCENIQMEYMLIFGSLEYELYQAYCKYLRLRRIRYLYFDWKPTPERKSLFILSTGYFFGGFLRLES